MDSRYTVSVVIPAFNRKDSIRRAVESVLNQTYEVLEVIVVDDASTDETSEIVSEIRDPRVQIYSNTHNVGVSAARNTGIRSSKAAWIAFQDSDDEWLPTKLEKQMERVATSHGDDFVAVYCGMRIVNSSHESIQYFPDRYVGLREGEILEVLLARNLISTQTLVVRRDILETIGGFDESLRALVDWDCVLRIAQLGPFAFVDEPLVNQYFSDNSITQNRRNRVEARQRIVEKYLSLFDGRPALLSRHYRIISGELRLEGEFSSACEVLRKARQLGRFNIRYWIIQSYLEVRRHLYY